MSIPVYYINLDTRPDRRDFMERQFEELGITAERFAAVTKSELATESRELGVNPGQLACGRSHAAVWRRLLDSTEERALVLEDDALLAPAVADLVRARHLPQADLLRIEARPEPTLLGRSMPGWNGPFQVRQLLSWAQGTAGYVISRSAAERWLAHPDLDRMPIDHFLFNRDGPCLTEDCVYATDPGFCIQLDLLPAQSEVAAARSDLISERDSQVPKAANLGARLARMRFKARLTLYDWTNIARRGALLRTTRRPVAFAGPASA